MHPILLSEIILSGFILAILSIGTFYDVKYREVSNKLTGLVGLISIPLIAINWNNIGYINLIFIILFFTLYFFNQLGGADVKVLVPLILIVPNPSGFMLILSVMGAVYAVISWQKKIPYFIPITMGYFMIIV